MDILKKIKKVGENVTIYDYVTIIKPENVFLNNNIIISEYCYLAAGKGLYIGNNIHISPFSSIVGGGFCILEDFVGLSAGVRLITGSEDISGGNLTNPTIPDEFRAYYRSYIICEKHSFLATNVIVHPDVTIGEGAVVGSGSIVTKDLEPWSIYMGRPAVKVKDRFKDKILEAEKNFYKKYNLSPSDFSDIKKKISI